MISKTLHALSNRTGPFMEASFAADPSFIPAKFTPEAVAFRNILQLSNLTTDYFLKIYLSILKGYPEIARLLDEEIDTFDSIALLPRGVSIDGGEWMPDGKFLDLSDTLYPVNLRYCLDFKEVGLATMSLQERGQVLTLKTQTFGNDPSKVLRPEWQDLPFTGTLRLTQVWQPNARVDIRVEPSFFPYDSLLSKLTQSVYLPVILMRSNLVDAFHNSMDITEKLALVLTALALDNQAVYPKVIVQ